MNLIKHTYRPLLDEKIEVAFLYQAATVWPSLESVYEYMIHNEKFSVKIVLMHENTMEVAHTVGAEEYLRKRGYSYVNDYEVDFGIYIPHIVFIQLPYDPAWHAPEHLSLQFVSRGSRVIYVPYGIEITDTQLSRRDHFCNFVVENSWRIYTSCEKIAEEYKKYCRNRGAVRITGSPKFDYLNCMDEFPLENEVSIRAGSRKIILWKIHFPKKIRENGKDVTITPDVSEYIKFTEYINQFTDFFFVIQAHPKLLHGGIASDVRGDKPLMDMTKLLIDKIKGLDNAYIDVSVDYRNSLYHADAIIMDRSGIMIEAALTGKPILFMANDTYHEPMTPPVEAIEESFEHGTTCIDIVRFLENISNGNDRELKRSKNVAETFFPLADGRAGKRICEDIIESIKVPENEPAHIVLYGCGGVCSWYINEVWKMQDMFKIVAICDSDAGRWGSSFCGIKIISPNKLNDINADAIVIMTETYYYDIKKYLVYDLYLDERIIYRLDDFVVSVMRGN